jgi:uncharacterized RDD family membrane protein YckC
MNTPNPYAAPKAHVADVDSAGDLVQASRGMRFLAFIVDMIIGWVVGYLPLILTGQFSSAMSAATSGNVWGFYGSYTGVAGLLAFASWVAWIVITIRLVSRNGQTIGKKLLNIKVVRTDGSKASLGRIFWLRNVVNYILYIVPFYFLVDWLFIFGERRQCVHDKIADTMVVNA